MTTSLEEIEYFIDTRVKQVLKRQQTYMNAQDVAALYPFTSAQAVRTLASRRKIPHRKVNGRLVFLKSELDEWIEQSPGFTLKDWKKKCSR